MYEYKIGDLAKMLTAALAASRDLGVAEDLGHDKAESDYCERLAIIIDGLAICCANCDMDSSLLKQMRTFERALKTGTTDTRSPVLHARLAALLEGVQDNLEKRKFMFVPADRAKYWNNPRLFGEDFLLTFPREAVFEMRELGNCYAAARGTACVFHCMRVAEYGLRKLAKKLHVTIQDNKKTCPLEYGDWDKVITAIRNKIGHVRQQRKGAKRERSLQMYSSAADHCEYMKDIWRNELSHTRRRYNKGDSLGAINRVRDFVQLIASHEGPKEINERIALLERIQKSLLNSAIYTRLDMELVRE